MVISVLEVIEEARGVTDRKIRAVIGREGRNIMEEKSTAVAKESSTTIDKENGTATEESPFVSVVMPVYNAEAFIRQALDSLQAQSLTEFEIICVDDGSTDSSYEILREYQKRDARIRIAQNTVPSDGAAMARNIGIGMAEGRYLSILDADDFFEPNLLETGYRRLEETQADLLIYDAYQYDNTAGCDVMNSSVLYKNRLPDKKIFSPQQCANQIFSLTWGAAWHMMYRRSFVERHGLRFQSLHHADDFLFVNLSLACAEKITWTPEKLLHYRFNNSLSQTSTKSKWPESCYQAALALKDELQKKGLWESYRVGCIRRSLDYAIYYLYSMDNVASMKKLYSDLRDKYFEKLGVFEISDEEFESEWKVRQRDAIMNHTFEEFLFADWERFCSDVLREIANYSFVKDYLPAGAELVIYGAGKMGKAVFSNLLYYSYFKICAWVDKRFMELGYPISDPEGLPRLRFDYIVVAVADAGAWQGIRRYLLDMGIDRRKLIWVEDLVDGFKKDRLEKEAWK